MPPKRSAEELHALSHPRSKRSYKETNWVSHRRSFPADRTRTSPSTDQPGLSWPSPSRRIAALVTAFVALSEYQNRPSRNSTQNRCSDRTSSGRCSTTSLPTARSGSLPPSTRQVPLPPPQCPLPACSWTDTLF